jgi:hypothetical protein
MAKKEEKNLALEKKKLCPFNPKLECEDCRLFQPYLDGGGKEACVFITISGNIGFMVHTGR